MYGYVVIDKSTIKQEEFILYSAFYCGLCKSIKNSFGQLARLTVSYDITFFAALIFDQLNYPVEFSLERCIGNPFKKKALIKDNDLMRTISDISIILIYYKVEDNIIDKSGGAKTIKRFLNKHHKNAAARQPLIEDTVKKSYSALRKIEKANQPIIDIAADSFASMLKECAAIVLGKNATDEVLRLVYNIGKFVYIIDGLDDIDEDFKSKNYNPFLAAFNKNGYTSRQQFIQSNYADLEFIFATTVNRAIECFNSIKFNQSYGLLENIIYYGLRKKVKEVLSSQKKLKKPKL